jgi:hypothetical protein
MAMMEEADIYPKYKDILEFGLYFKYIEKYLDFFPKDNMLFLEYEQFLSEEIDMTPVTRFLDVLPICDSPPSKINEGSRNWNLCVVDFIRALGTYRYDENMNIMGRHNHPYLESFNESFPVLRNAFSNDPIEIDPEVLESLRLFYEKDVTALKHSGLLVPSNWNNKFL